MRRICIFVELFKFFFGIFVFGFAEGSMCVFCQQIVLFSNMNCSSRKKQKIAANQLYLIGCEFLPLSE